MPPEVIAGRYRVEREIGRGGMGAVWLCRDDLLGRAVAVKQIGRLPGESTTDLARAMREARSSAALNHRNVVSVFDAVEEGDHVWLVMEYVRGRTLSQLLAAEGPLSPERVVWIGAQVADGLAAAHARGTVHRDVKPGNVLITEDDRALISDFGIARTQGDATLTRSGMVTGTPSYMAPELARGGDPSPAADVWSLGATLYAAVEGGPPYVENGNALAVLARIASDPPPAPVRAGFLGDALGRMLDRDPASRWQMADAATALHRLHERYADDHTREQPVATPAAAAAAPVAAAAASPDTEPTSAPEPAPPSGPGPGADPSSGAEPPAPAASSRRRGRVRPVLLALLVVLLVGAGLAWWAMGDPDPGGSAAPAPHRSASSRPTPTPSSSASSSAPASPSSPSSPSSSAPASSSMLTFPRTYYGVLPDDTKSGWEMLSPGFQKEVGGYGHYKGFWDTISSVSVGDVSSAGPGAVDVDLTYTSNDGSTSSETRRLYLERSGDSYVITGDEVVG